MLAAINHGEHTPHSGDFFCCPACYGVSVLRVRTMHHYGWTLTKPIPRERLAIAQHDGVKAILREYEIAQFGDGVSAL